MQRIGKMLGAQVVVSGSLSRTGAVYYLGFRALNVEGATVDAQYKSDIANDRRLGNLLQGQPMSTPPIAAPRPPVTPTPAPVALKPATSLATPIVPPKQSAPVPVPTGLEYQVKTGGTVTITKYSSTAASVVIPSAIEGKPVTAIGSKAFRDCSGLTSVSLPAGITSISNEAFSGCSGLTSVSLPAGITSIGYYAFSGCTRLTFTTNGGAWTTAANGKILIKDGNTVTAAPGASGAVDLSSLTGITSIGTSAFYRSGLTSVTLPTRLTSIGSSAFSGCTGLTSVTLPASLTSIGDYAFADCSGLTRVILPACITSIGFSTFFGCTSLTSVTLPASLTSIGGWAFYGCTSLTSVTLPASLTSIDHYAFDGCTRLTSVTLPAGLTSIGNGAFSGCTGLTFITNGRAWTTAASGKILIKDGNTLALYPGASGAVDLSSLTGLTSIGNGAFSGYGLTSITLPAGITSIGDHAFYCSGLQTVVFGGSGVTIYDSSVFSSASSGVSLKTAYEVGKTGSNKGVAGTYKRNAMGYNAGSWSRQ
jgi:uncharacterized ParB-like nuclease family protein